MISSLTRISILVLSCKAAKDGHPYIEPAQVSYPRLRMYPFPPIPLPFECGWIENERIYQPLRTGRSPIVRFAK